MILKSDQSEVDKKNRECTPILRTTAHLCSSEKQSTPPTSILYLMNNSITNAMLELKNKFNISSFKPHLNYYECHVNLIINKKLNLPIKMYLYVF